MNGKELFPVNTEGLEKYRFFYNNGIIFVYHYTRYKTPLHGKSKEGWLCCTEGWRQRDDGKWYESLNCGFRSRNVQTLDDVFNVYRE